MLLIYAGRRLHDESAGSRMVVAPRHDASKNGRRCRVCHSRAHRRLQIVNGIDDVESSE